MILTISRSRAHIHEGQFSDEILPLYTNPMLFWMALFCSAGALRDYKGIEGILELLDVRVDQQTPVRKIEWNPAVLDKPVFKGTNGRILTAGVFTRDFRDLQVRAGFPEPAGLQDIRAENLTQIGPCDEPICL